MKKTQKKPIKKAGDNNPVPVIMGDLKPLYRSEAMRLDRSMNWLMRQALNAYVKTFPIRD